MEYINLHTSALDSEAFQDAERAQQATWLALLRFCCGQENGGRIREAAGFDDRKWLRTARVSREEVMAECRLWKWKEADLWLEFYPLKQESTMKQKRLSGGKGGKQRAANASRRASSTRGPSASSTPPLGASTEGKGREGKEREGKEREGPADGALSGNEWCESGQESGPCKRLPQVQEPAHIPSWEEFAGEFIADGIPAPWLREKLDYLNEMPERWIDQASGRLKPWRKFIRRWWADGRSSFPTGGQTGSGSEKKRGAGQSVASLKFELDREISALEADLNAKHWLDQPLPKADTERLRELKKKRVDLRSAGEGSGK
jgi:hypothetical protein